MSYLHSSARRRVSRHNASPFIRFIFLFTFGLTLWAGSVDAKDPTTKDISYKDIDPRNVLDLYYPETGTAPRPAHIYIHGGGWTGGTKNLGNPAVKAVFEKLAENGFVGISVEYRVRNADKNIFIRESSVDAMDAVRYVFKNAEKLGIDKNEIFLWGTSAGAHLALLCAGVEPGELAGALDLKNVPTPVKGVLAWFPPTDMTNYEDISVTKNGKLRKLSDRMGRSVQEDPAAYREISPLENLTDDYPPVYLLHGDKDRTVNMEHSVRFDQKARELGLTSQLQIVKNAGHGFARKPGATPFDPDEDFITSTSAKFFTDLVSKR